MSIFDYRVDDDGIATITWDDPSRATNVLSPEVWPEIAACIEKIASDDKVSGAILTSGKKTFVTGGDLAALERLAAEGVPDNFIEATRGVNAHIRRLETCGKPIVAAIGGTALGGGYEIALACHYRVVADDEKIQIGLPEVQLGLMPALGGTQRLPRLIGIQAALGFILEGKPSSPSQALKAGLVDKVVPAEQLLAEAKRWLLEEPRAVQPWDKKGFDVPGGGIESKTGAQAMMGVNAMIRAKTYGNYPASKAILSCFWEGLRLPMDRATNVEGRYLHGLLSGPVSRNMIRTMFFGVQSANKLERRPAGIPRLEVKKIGVLGAGLMGAGVAFVAAKVGLDVVLLDRDREAADKGKDYGRVQLDKAIERKRSTPDQKERVLGRIQATADYADLQGCDLVIEAVFEDREVKAAVTKRAEAVLAKTAVFGSNTSTLPITGLAKESSRPTNFIGVHFFSPVDKMPLVEVIRGEKTSDETLAKTLDFIQRINKTPIVVNDSRGFYTSRVFGTYITEGIGMLADGVNPALIENAGKMSGMPMPPLGLADEVGLALMHSVGKQTRRDLGDQYKSNPSTPVLELLVTQAGRSGRKHGAGFYEYPEAGKKRLWAGLAEHFPHKKEQPSADEVIKRYLYTQALETARCVEEGVITSAADADVGAILGWGFAAYTGGPLSYIDTIGLREFVIEADRLARDYGERFSPPRLLRDMAEKNQTFY